MRRKYPFGTYPGSVLVHNEHRFRSTLLNKLIVGRDYMLLANKSFTDTEASKQTLPKEIPISIKDEGLVHTLPGIYYVISTDGKLLDWNKKLEEVSGYSSEEISTLLFSDLFEDRYQPSIDSHITNVITEGAAEMRLPLLGKNNEGRQCLFSSKEIIIDGQACIKGLALHIPDQKRSKDARLLDKYKQMNAELKGRVKEQTSQLEKANKEIASFSYSVSHDLRAPLRAILGYSTLLLDDHADNLNGEGVEFLEILKNESERLGELIDGLLFFSRMNRKEKELITCSMKEVIEMALKEIEPVHNSENYTLNIGDMPEIKMDPKLIKQVWISLIENAIIYKKADEKVAIDIQAEARGDKMVFSISDTGMGFDERYYKKIFGVFERLHHTSGIQGIGLGLALVQRIVVRHNGTVWVDSETGTGSTFYFSLPKKIV